MNTRDDVKQFMIAGDALETGIDSNQAKLYKCLVQEEFEELMTAFANKDIVEIADACADLHWVIEGLEITLGLPQQEIWDEVKRSNFSKVDAKTNKIIKRADGKIMKPDTYSPPDIRKILEKQ